MNMLWYDTDRMSFNIIASSSKRLDLGEDKTNLEISTQNSNIITLFRAPISDPSSINRSK